MMIHLTPLRPRGKPVVPPPPLLLLLLLLLLISRLRFLSDIVIFRPREQGAPWMVDGTQGKEPAREQCLFLFRAAFG